ncbi:hypothetical protein GTY75_08800 [Streptomyces sp. SID8381]|uniref:hypothetical protein n=1 Tax=unclassified Streptomyces TaxID=2593676 RepID=UPI000378DA95|nr:MULTISPECIES: hypothetical protein [unclassified Streptomyces]MYX26767.1 hypothetical protein [Streptomyces sp. SID8381]
MNTTPKDKPGRHRAGARLARELAGLLLVAAGMIGLVTAAFAVHPLVGTGLVAAVLVGFGSWTLYQRPRPRPVARAVGTVSATAGTLLAVALVWALSPLGGLATASALGVGAGLWLTSGEVR